MIVLEILEIHTFGSALHSDRWSLVNFGGLNSIRPAADLIGGVSSKIGLLDVSGSTIFTLDVVDKSFLQWALKEDNYELLKRLKTTYYSSYRRIVQFSLLFHGFIICGLFYSFHVVNFSEKCTVT